MDEQGRLWVDVGGLLGWRGTPTGIQRTVLCLLGQWLTQRDVPIRLCYYDRAALCYRPLGSRAVKRLGIGSSHRSRPGPTAPWKHTPARKNPDVKFPPTLFEEVASSLGHVCEIVRLTVSFPFRLLWTAARPAGLAVRTGAQAVARRARDGPVSPSPFRPQDILFLPMNSWDDTASCKVLADLRRNCGVPIVSLIYDVIPLKYPWVLPAPVQQAFAAWFPEIFSVSDAVVTISDSSRRDILVEAERLNLPSRPVEVIRLGDEPPRDQPASRPHRLVESCPFVLTVGTIDVRKNQGLLFQLWRRLIEYHGGRVPMLVLAGRSGWLMDDLFYQLEHDPLLKGRVLIVPEPSDAELCWLYEHCLFTLYPSHYEGWGLPVAEALAHGKYCLCSNSSSLPEIAGDLIDYHDPLDLPACQRLVERVLFEPGFLQERQERIRREFRITPWKECARQVLQAIGRHEKPWQSQTGHAA